MLISDPLEKIDLKQLIELEVRSAMIRIQNITFYNYLPYYKEKVFDLSGKEGTTH